MLEGEVTEETKREFGGRVPNGSGIRVRIRGYGSHVGLRLGVQQGRRLRLTCKLRLTCHIPPPAYITCKLRLGLELRLG